MPTLRIAARDRYIPGAESENRQRCVSVSRGGASAVIQYLAERARLTGDN